MSTKKIKEYKTPKTKLNYDSLYRYGEFRVFSILRYIILFSLTPDLKSRFKVILFFFFFVNMLNFRLRILSLLQLMISLFHIYAAVHCIFFIQLLYNCPQKNESQNRNLNKVKVITITIKRDVLGNPLVITFFCF